MYRIVVEDFDYKAEADGVEFKDLCTVHVFRKHGWTPGVIAIKIDSQFALKFTAKGSCFLIKCLAEMLVFPCESRLSYKQLPPEKFIECMHESQIND